MREAPFRAFVVALFLLAPLEALAQRADPLEKHLIKVAHNIEWAVIPLMYWGPNGTTPDKAGVVGTGFLINDDGYFITAAHVLALYKADSPQLGAVIRQNKFGGGSRWFEVIEKDESHDLALCRIIGYTAHLPKDFNREHPDIYIPFASVRVAKEAVKTGQFIVLAGFPLGSWNPAIQLGTIAATETVSPNAGRVPAGQRELLQISVSGNKGNSGSPVISLRTGDVVGVVIQEIPAPLYSSIETPLPFGQSSGIMLAAPASWVQELLRKHNVTSVMQPPS
jgi:S1-C subfamily serine protease